MAARVGSSILPVAINRLADAEGQLGYLAIGAHCGWRIWWADSNAERKVELGSAVRSRDYPTRKPLAAHLLRSPSRPSRRVDPR